MLSYYEILLVPTDVDEEQLEQRYYQILDSEDRWSVDPYYPIPLSLFWTAYQTLLDPTKRAAYDQENNIVPQEASYKTCFQWTAIAQHFRTVSGAGIMVPKGGPNNGRTNKAEAANV